jgi:hypothetical protein
LAELRFTVKDDSFLLLRQKHKTARDLKSYYRVMYDVWNNSASNNQKAVDHEQNQERRDGKQLLDWPDWNKDPRPAF